MQLLIKYLSQWLLLPFLERIIKAIFDRVEKWNQERIERKALEAANRELNRRVKEYEDANADDAFDVHP